MVYLSVAKQSFGNVLILLLFCAARWHNIIMTTLAGENEEDYDDAIVNWSAA